LRHQGKTKVKNQKKDQRKAEREIHRVVEAFITHLGYTKTRLILDEAQRELSRRQTEAKNPN